MYSFYSYLAKIIAIIGILAVFYFGSRWLVDKKGVNSSDRKIQILEKMAVSSDAYILMFKANNKIYTLMVHKNSSELIDCIEQEEIEREVL